MVNKWQIFREVYIASLNENVSCVLSGASRSNNQRWMNRETARARNLKKIKWERYRRNPTPENYSEYQRCRNDSVKINREAKVAYEMMLANEIEQGNPKPFYAYMRSQTTLRESVNRVRKPDGTLTRSLKETADVMNATFHSVFVVEGGGDQSRHPTLFLKEPYWKM